MTVRVGVGTAAVQYLTSPQYLGTTALQRTAAQWPCQGRARWGLTAHALPCAAARPFPAFLSSLASVFLRYLLLLAADLSSLAKRMPVGMLLPDGSSRAMPCRTGQAGEGETVRR